MRQIVTWLAIITNKSRINFSEILYNNEFFNVQNILEWCEHMEMIFHEFDAN